MATKPKETERVTKPRKDIAEPQEEDIEATEATDEAVVKTTDGLPDMRFRENQEKFKIDPSQTVGGKPDERRIENRPDIQHLHEQRGDDKPNLKEEAKDTKQA